MRIYSKLPDTMIMMQKEGENYFPHIHNCSHLCPIPLICGLMMALRWNFILLSQAWQIFYLWMSGGEKDAAHTNTWIHTLMCADGNTDNCEDSLSHTHTHTRRHTRSSHLISWAPRVPGLRPLEWANRVLKEKERWSEGGISGGSESEGEGGNGRRRGRERERAEQNGVKRRGEQARRGAEATRGRRLVFGKWKSFTI